MDVTNRLLIDLYRSARVLPIPEFQEHTVQLLQSVCRIESVMCGTGSLHAESGVGFNSIFLHNISDEFISAHDEIADQDILVKETVNAGGRVCAFNLRELMPARKYPNVAAFDARFELQNTLGQLIADSSSESINGIFLWRSKIADRFSEDERRLGAILLPHFIEASTINRLVWLTELTASSIARRGVRAIASTRGILHTHDTAFLELLQQEWRDWSPPALPRALIAALQRSAPHRYNGARISVAAEEKHGMLFLLAREKKGVDGLTPTQLAVARLIARGHAYKQVAETLRMSIATVRNHIHAVYKKVGVPNKAALARWLSERSR